MAKAPITGYTVRLFLQSFKDMRDYQKEYFKTKSSSWLAAAKRAEQKCDRLYLALAPDPGNSVDIDWLQTGTDSTPPHSCELCGASQSDRDGHASPVHGGSAVGLS
jgi:hypothetical protein